MLLITNNIKSRGRERERERKRNPLVRLV